jgi:hypothetical protein
VVNTLAIFWWVLGGLQVLGALLFGVLMGGFGLIPLLTSGGDEDALVAGGVLLGLAFFMSVFMTVMALPTLLTAWGLQKRKGWARILAMVLGALQLLSIPIGTAMGIYTIVVLTKPEVVREFS